ncbi:MAG: tRNA (guanosine(37)-N1)-methyltransferase TrmD [Bdellovibrionales bacterium]|nr:tRNA (guanosine(37)-N1)-methyltransferase TrmD [Bdellovibrionales bacterium]
MRFNVITLFPELIEGTLRHGVVGQALKREDIQLHTVNPRSFTADIHHTVDDRPYGGGDGMVMLYSPLRQALESLGDQAGHRVMLSAHGKKWSDSMARTWVTKDQPITLICGRYGGVDQRFINDCIDEEVSIGDYILSGGELGALVLIDSISRFLPGVLGNEISHSKDSFSDDGLLEAPLFTRPQRIDYSGVESAGDNAKTQPRRVPSVFLSGDHARINSIRRVLSILLTLQKRPDLVTSTHLLELKKSAVFLKDFSIEDYSVCGITAETISQISGANL